MDADFTTVVGWIVGIVVVVEFFHIGYVVNAIRKGMVALEGQATQQTCYLAAISVNVAKWVRESSQSNVDGPKS
jgi:hypothetical protein